MIRCPILLIGMMLSGKSTVGPLLARRLDAPFVDLDDAIALRTGRSVPSWFADEGEPAFRRAEAEILSALLDERPAAVIAAGGGAFEDPDSRARALSAAWVVYLEASAEALAARLRPGRGDRPLLAGPRPAAEVLAELLERRGPNYRAAHYTVPTDGASPRALAETIAATFGATANSDAGTGATGEVPA